MVPHPKIIIHIHNDMNMNIHIDINMNIEIYIIINMNIEDYERYYLLFIRYSLLGMPYWVCPIGYALLGIPTKTISISILA